MNIIKRQFQYKINTCYNVPRLCNHFESISYFIHAISVREEHELFLLEAPKQRIKTGIYQKN